MLFHPRTKKNRFNKINYKFLKYRQILHYIKYMYSKFHPWRYGPE